MDMLVTKLHCSQCGTVFSIELRTELYRMRLNSPNPCPSCGAECGVSKDQAIKAHRLIEKLEQEYRMAV